MTQVGFGNIGSPAAQAVARLADVSAFAVNDFDRVEAKDVVAQMFQPQDVGRRRGFAARRMLRDIRPDLEVTVYPERFECVPKGFPN